MDLKEACHLAEDDSWETLAGASDETIIEAMRVLTAAHLDPKLNCWVDNLYACYVAELFYELDERNYFRTGEFGNEG